MRCLRLRFECSKGTILWSLWCICIVPSAQNVNSEGSECALRALRAKRMLRKVKHEAWASLGKRNGVLGKTQSRALLGKTQACLLGKTRYARGKT